MNNIPLTKGGNLVINANNGTGDWNDAAKDKYKIDGDMEKMFDTTVEADKVIAYNLFTQTATNGTGASTTDVKTSMPHFVLKLATNASGTASTRWLTIRALKAADALVTSFDAGKVYVLNATGTGRQRPRRSCQDHRVDHCQRETRVVITTITGR